MSCSVLSKMGETNFLALFCPPNSDPEAGSHLFSCAIYFLDFGSFLGSPLVQEGVKRIEKIFYAE